MDNYETRVLKEKIINCDNLPDLQSEILAKIKTHREIWKEKINEIIEEGRYSKIAFAELCGVSRITVTKWCNGAFPQNRETFIKIGFSANFNLKEMNSFLQRYGKYPALYAKSLEDSVCIFVLNSSEIPHTYQECEKIMERIKKRMQGETVIKDVYETSGALEKVLSLSTEAELIKFVEENSAMFKTAYRKFYAYVEAFIQINNHDPETGKPYSTHALAEFQQWSSSLRQCISAIHKKQWFPIRRKVISLGLYLNMDLEQIDEMLRLAQMEPLCAKNPIESAVIYAVEDAVIRDMVFQDGSVELCSYVRDVLIKLELQDSTEFLNEL